HTIYQTMNLAFADRDFYYGDPYFTPRPPIQGLLSKEYARQRAALIDPLRNDPYPQPGDPYAYQGGTNPFRDLLARRKALFADTAGLKQFENFMPSHDAIAGHLNTASGQEN